VAISVAGIGSFPSRSIPRNAGDTAAAYGVRAGVGVGTMTCMVAPVDGSRIPFERGNVIGSAVALNPSSGGFGA